jgi:hypothetical protein
MNWIRKSYVTCGSDPTEVVEWASDLLTITEFQQVYDVEYAKPIQSSLEEVISTLGEALHEALEHVHDLEREIKDMNEPYEGDPDFEIYGHA